MALHLNHDHQGRTYFALSCDGCGAAFTCYDDGCYNLASLRTEAVFAGWDAGQRPEQTHRCPSCLIPDTTTGRASARPPSAATTTRPGVDGRRSPEASADSVSVVDWDAGHVTSHHQDELGRRPRRPGSSRASANRRSATEVTPGDQAGA